MNLKIYIQKQTNRISILSWLYYFYLKIMEEKSVLETRQKWVNKLNFIFKANVIMS